MPPRNVGIDYLSSVEDEVHNEVEPVVTEETMQQKRPPMQLVWRNIIWMGALHLGALFGLYCIPFCHPLTWLWSKYFYNFKFHI